MQTSWKRRGTLHIVLFLCHLERYFPRDSTGGSVTLPAQAAAQRKTVCPPPCPGPSASEPPLSPLQKWTLRPSSKLCSSPPHSPPPPLSPPAHRPPPLASRYRLCLVWIHRLSFVYKHIATFSVFTCKLRRFILTAGSPTFSHKKPIFTHLIYTTSLKCSRFYVIQLITCVFLIWTSGRKCDVICCFNLMWRTPNQTGCVGIFFFLSVSSVQFCF